jgi:hypothetical protein
MGLVGQVPRRLGTCLIPASGHISSGSTSGNLALLHDASARWFLSRVIGLNLKLRQGKSSATRVVLEVLYS